MEYSVELTPAAARQLRKLDRQVQVRMYAHLKGLQDDPRPPGVIQLRGTSETLHRIREGDYRIIYIIEDDLLLVLVVRIAHRSEAYR
jgi:mRNA interferase RelE/StbE